MSCVNKRNNEFNIEEQLKKLTCPDDAVEKLAEEVPVLDDDAKERILRLCEKKMNINTTNKKQIEITKNDYDASNVVKGVDRYKKPKWYRTAMSTAASLILVAGIGGGAYFINKNNQNVPTESLSSINSNNTVNELEELFKKNIYLYDNAFITPLDYSEEIIYHEDEKSRLFGVEDNELFSDYESFSDYVYSVYTEEIAYYYLNVYPNNMPKYKDFYGAFCVDVNQFGSGDSLVFNYKDYDINIIDVSDKNGLTTCRFDVIVDGEIYNTFDEITEEIIEDFVIGAEAVKVDDGWRLTGTYGRDTIKRLRYADYVDEYRGFIDNTWKEEYLSYIEMNNNRNKKHSLVDLDDNDIPELFIYDERYPTSSYDSTMCIFIDGEYRILGNYAFSNEIGLYKSNINYIEDTQREEKVTEFYGYKYGSLYTIRKLTKDPNTNECYIDGVSCTEAEYNEALEISNIYKEKHCVEYTYYEIIDFLMERIDGYTMDEMQRIMSQLFVNNVQCFDILENNNNNNTLALNSDVCYNIDENNELYPISISSSSDFTNVEEYEAYIRSIYTTQAADEILSKYPNLIVEHSHTFCYNKKANNGNRGYFVDWNDFGITINEFDLDSSTCSFTVIAKIQEPGELPPEDYIIECEAVKEGDYGWRLKKFYF